MHFLDRFDAAAGRLGEVLATGDLSAPVPACPGWTLGDLGGHTGRIHQWARHAVVHGDPDATPTEAPADRAGLAEWYLGSARALSATLREADPAAPAWGFGPKPRTVAFWHRRQAHEASMHLVDALASQGAPAPETDDEFATDGINEVFQVFAPRQQRLGRMTDTGCLLHLGTGPDWWMFGALGEAEAPAGSVTGPAPVVLLLLWGRTGLDDPRLEVGGDREAAAAVLASGLVP